MIGVDLVTDGLLEAIAKYDGSSKVHVIRQLVRSAARSHYGTIEAALLEVRNG
jgi:adenine-specific DNA methylase